MKTRHIRKYWLLTRLQAIAFLLFVGYADLPAKSQTINMLFFHFESRAYHITREVVADSIDHYIAAYRDYLYDPDGLKQRMHADFSFARDQVAQKKIFHILDKFKQELKTRQEFQDVDLALKVHFILWDEAFDFLKQEAKNPTFSVVQIAGAFLGGLAEYNNIVPLDPFCAVAPEQIYDAKCLRSCRLENNKELLALPFWASMTSLLIRKDMIAACPGLDMETIFSDWESFENAGRLFNRNLDVVRGQGFANLQSFWAINISDKDMNTLHTLAPAIYAHGGQVLQDRWWWQEVGINKPEAMAGIKRLFDVTKNVGLLEECTFGDLLNRFHAGRYAVVMCGTWENLYWRNTNPDSSGLIEIKLPPASPQGPATLLWGCNLVILKNRTDHDYRLEYELISFLSTSPVVQNEYVPANSRLSVLKNVQDVYSDSNYYRWLADDRIVQVYPNNKEIFRLFNALTQKYYLASILQNVKGAAALTDDVWRVIDNSIRATAFELNKQVIPPAIFNIFYTKISIIFIILFFSLVGFTFVYVVKRVIRTEDEKINDLTERLKNISDEKVTLESQEKTARERLAENQKLMESLNAKLESVTQEYVALQTSATFEKVEKYTGKIRELMSRNAALQKELEQTTQQISSNDRVVAQLEEELDDFKNPEVYIDFAAKTIHKKDGSPFVLSSAANQYKNDAFRYLEYIVRHDIKRIHLLEFGYIDSRFFQKALAEGSVRDYNYQGKCAKVRSGINKTFKNNIGKEFIVQDQENIYVYFANPKKIYQINTQDRSLDITLAEIAPHDYPQVVTFLGYETFDFYQVNDQIKITSNIQESMALYRTALGCEKTAEKIARLEQAIELDEKNYAAFALLLTLKPVVDMEKIKATQNRLRDGIKQLADFLGNDLNYRKNIHNLKRIKNEYKQLYAWKYVNAVKSDELVEIGERAFGEIISYKVAQLQNLLAQRQQAEQQVQKYWLKLESLKTLGKYLQSFIKKPVLMQLILDYNKWAETAGLAQANNEFDETDIKKNFIGFLIRRFGSDDDAQKTAQLVYHTYNFFEWLQHEQNGKGKITTADSDKFFRQYRLEDWCREKIEQLLAAAAVYG